MSKRPIEERREPRIEFLGEQDGPFERDLKAELSKWFAGEPHVRQAYLAQVGFQPSDERSVALCILATKADNAIVVGAQAIFHRLFAVGTHMDIVFVTDAQADDLQRVCKPFYESST